MAELSLGASGNVFIDAGQIVRVSTSGVATVVMQYGGPAGTDTITANTRDYGPYGVPAKIRITATSGTVTYRELDETPTFTPAQVQGLQGLVSRAGKRGAARPTYCSVGNSISAQSGPGYGVAYSTEFYSDIQVALALTGHCVQPVRIGGSSTTTLPSGAIYSDGMYGWSGATSISIAADLPNFMSLIGNVDVFFISAMENDPPTGGSAAATQAAYDSIIAQCLARGAQLIYWKMCLPNTGINSAPKLALYWTLRKYVEGLAASIPQLRIVSTYDLWTDSSNAYPVPLNSGLFANYTDGTVHPRKGALWLGRRLAEAMALDGLTYERRVETPAVGNPGFIAGSANMVGTGGTFSGGYTGTPATPPAGITVSTNVTGITASTANAAVYQGRPCLDITVAAAAQAAVNNAFQILMTAQTTGWAVGDTVQLLVEVVVSGSVPVTGVRNMNLELRLAGASGSAYWGRHVSGETYNEDVIYDRPMLLATPLLIVPAGTTSLRPFFTATTDAANPVAMRVQLLGFRLVNWSQAT